jgi:hypothetical protein
VGIHSPPMRLIVTLDFPDLDGTKDDPHPPHEVLESILDQAATGYVPSFTPGIGFEVRDLHTSAIWVSSEWAS